MSIFRSVVLAATVALVLANPVIAGGVKMKTYSIGENKCIDVENKFYKITIVPNGGGRIFKWLDKLNDTTLTQCDIPSNDHFRLGGMLDDRGRLSSANYKYAVNQISPDVVTVSLWADDIDSGLGVEKTLSFKANSPVVNVHYKYSNNSQDLITGFNIGIRNFIHPSGNTVTTDDRYLLPTTHGVRRILGYDWKNVTGGPMPELSSKLLRNMSAPWHAFINTKLKHGVGVSLEGDFYDGWYFWKPRVAKPTYEWTYKDLPAGHYRETSFNLTQLNDLTGLAFLSGDIAVEMKVSVDDLKMTIDTDLRPFTNIPTGTLKTKVRLVTGKWKKEQVANIPAIAIDGNQKHSSNMKLPSEGLYEVTQTLSAKEIDAHWRDTVPVGKNTTTSPIFSMRYNSVSQPKPIPGWVGPKKVSFSPTLEAKKTGFAITSPVIDNACSEMKNVKISIGKNEFESRELLFFPTGSNGQVTVSVKGGEAVNAYIRIQEDLKVDAYKYGQGIVEAKILFDGDSFDGGRRKSVWLTVGGRKSTVGRHKFEVVFSAGGDRTKTVPVEVNVKDVSLPIKPLISLEAEGSPMNFPVGKDAKLFDYWLKDMSDHGIDFFQGTLIGPRIYGNLKILGTKTQLSYDIQKRPDFYKAGKNLPDLDFSYLDYYLDKALANGLVRIKTHRYDISTPTLIEKHVAVQAAKYLMSKGYQKSDMFVKILDEQPVDKFPAMAKTAKWLKRSGFRPFSTFNCLFGHPEELRIISPHFDMYQGAFTTRKEREQRLKEGLLKPDDMFPNYTGFGTCLQTYETMLPFGLNAAAMGHRMFHCHEYMRGGNGRLIANIIFINSDNKPCDSPAFEGLRDGIDTANLWDLYRQWRKLLKSEKEFSALFAKLDAEYDKILNASSPLLDIKVVTNRGFTAEYIEKTTTKNYRQVRLILLDILDELKKASKEKIGLKYATIDWNEYKIWNQSCSFSCKAKNGKNEEKEAAKSFVEVLSDHSGVPASALKSGTPGINIVFELSNSQTFPYTYQISRGDGEIKITAKTKDNLILGGKNLVKTMSVSGVWR